MEAISQREGQAKQFTASALKQLAQYSWPGNVRELRNAVQRAYVMEPGPLVGQEWLPRPPVAIAQQPAPVHPAAHALHLPQVPEMPQTPHMPQAGSMPMSAPLTTPSTTPIPPPSQRMRPPTTPMQPPPTTCPTRSRPPYSCPSA